MKTQKKLTRKQRAALQSAAAKKKNIQAPPIAPAQPDDVVLGTLNGSADSTLDQTSGPVLTSADDLLGLPKGAVVAIRRSGGFVFRSDEVTAYADGSVTHRNSAFGSVAKPAQAGTLTEAQQTQLRQLLDPQTFTAFTATMAPVPDSYVVELAAQVGAEIKRGEVAELFATEPARSIIRMLTMFIPF